MPFKFLHCRVMRAGNARLANNHGAVAYADRNVRGISNKTETDLPASG